MENFDSHDKIMFPNPHHELGRKHESAKIETNYSSVMSLDFALDGGGLLKSDNLFLFIGSNSDAVRFSSLSVTNAWHCTLPISSIFLTVSTTLESVMSRVPAQEDPRSRNIGITNKKCKFRFLMPNRNSNFVSTVKVTLFS